MMLTKEELEAAMPPQLRGNVTDTMVDSFNKVITDPLHAEHMKENLISYSKVLSEGKFKLEDYMSAVIYVSYKLMGHKDKEAYSLTFPDRYTQLVARGATSSNIAAYVSIYNKGKLVNLIYEQTMIPSYVLNQDVRQSAINKLAELMRTATSEKVQRDAADSLLQHLKPPETTKVSLEIGMKNDDAMADLQQQLLLLARQQQRLIGLGVPTNEIAQQTLMVNRDVEDAQLVEE